MTPTDLLPSWRPGSTRDRVISFLERSLSVPVSERVAYFDNDGTLWCERPNYVQFDFFVNALAQRIAAEPDLAEKAEFAAILNGDEDGIHDLGLPRIALALAGLFSGLTPEEFTEQVSVFISGTTHPETSLPPAGMVYQPMLELIEALRERGFTVGIVTGGGAEFVRAVSQDLYGVPPELVVGTRIAYDCVRDERGRLELRRTAHLFGEANEGMAKVTGIQTQLGRRPILAAGNTRGDREMLEWAMSGDHPSLALLVDHDDPAREYEYTGEAATIDETEPMTVLASRLGWTTVSIRRDWETVFPV